LMGGRLDLESEPGRGAKFVFNLVFPVVARAAAPVRPTQDGIPVSHRRLKILLVEDNVVNQKVAMRLLERMGHRVDKVGDGRQAVAAVQVVEYDLVLMDCQMPVMDGYAATQAIRGLECGRNLPIIAMTAHAMPEDRRRCLDAGMDDYLAKPISTDQLYDCLESLGGRRAAAAS
jgi:CheY-like chemotaxis protein